MTPLVPALGNYLAACILTLSASYASTAYAQDAASSAIAVHDMLKPDTMAARVAACTNCHGSNGQAGPDGYYPRLAGKPAGYLFQQLVHFRDGTRSYDPMRYLLQGLSDDYLHEISSYFSSIKVAYPAASHSTMPGTVIEKGRILAQTGMSQRNLPACASCHGAQLSGLSPAIPGLLGLPRDYIISQLGAWRTGLRHARQPDCMGNIAKQLEPDEIEAVASWLAMQTVSEPYLPEAANTNPLPLECGSQSAVNANEAGQ